ncbi:MAG: DnaJ domain-containing protein, partial [Candidatus Marinimicrobia bacterium]|nr:DnaJ domain-containing protein [Candidatus Neomarinimicrobiota bacterium]
MKKYYEILGLKQGATKQDIKKAFNKLSKELDPKKNDNQDFFIEETKKLKEAYDKLMNSSILSSKRVKESKQNDDSQDNNIKSEKENTDPSTNEKSNFMKIFKEISVAVLSIAMIKVITQLL